MNREKLVAALQKPVAQSGEILSLDHFDPWGDVIEGIYGGYAEESDQLMIAALEAVQNGSAFAFAKERGFAGEFMLYVLAGHGMTDYGTSPRGAWPEPAIADLFPPLIDKWKKHSQAQWS
jgi:hypothetical protein